MTQLELARLNRILGDSLGLNVHGDPIYKWIWSLDLTFPLRSKETETTSPGGIIIFEPSYTWEPQVVTESWILAKWISSEGSYDQWLSQFGTEVPFPARGLYYTTDVILPPGLEPNEPITYENVGSVRALRHLTLSQIVEAIKVKQQRSEQRTDARIADFVADKATAFGNVPGKRGGRVSFGGV